MVMGRDSCSKGREFESRHYILDGHFSHLFVVKIEMCNEETKINEKEAEVGPQKKVFYINRLSKSFNPLFDHVYYAAVVYL